ncbi:MAG: TatD family hydrolase [Microbacteriaceae bacterium]|nr:TatD family hydrolase [Microbacteriaceae bacterium]
MCGAGGAGSVSESRAGQGSAELTAEPAGLGQGSAEQAGKTAAEAENTELGQIRFWREDERKWEWPEPPEPLPSPVIDNHTHLDFAAGPHAPTPLEALEKAAAVGVTRIVQVGTDLETSIWSAKFAANNPRVLAAIALHPNDAPEVAERGQLDEQLAALDELAAQPRVRAIGETGLDYFRTDETGRASQTASFEAHIALAKKHGIALQIHDRDAHDDVVATLLRMGAPERTVFHCFSGDAELAKTCNDNGWYMSFSGTATFKNAPYLREALEIADHDLVLVETDAPFLTPEPVRGRPNAPYLLPYTVRRLADHLGEDLAEFAARTAANTERVYGSWETGL